MMWSCLGEFLDGRKDESGLILRRCLVRRYEDSCRRVTEVRQNRHFDLVEIRSRMGLRSNADSMAGMQVVEQAKRVKG